MVSVLCWTRDGDAWAHLQAGMALHRIDCARVGSEAALLRSLRGARHDLVIVEIDQRPGTHALFLSWLGNRLPDAVQVVLLGRGLAPEHVAAAFDAGADDYCALPLEPVAFMARVRALLRRSGRMSARSAIAHSGFELDLEAGQLRDRGAPVALTPREFALAWLFFSRPGVFILPATIGTAIGQGSPVAIRTVEQHICQLRKKLALGAARGVRIRSAYPHGFRLEVAPGAAPAPA